MRVEVEIGFEAAFAELGQLYEAARKFADLATRAEEELLPAITMLSGRLRHQLRQDSLSAPEIDRTAREVSALQADWRAALHAVRESDPYREACRAWRDDDQPALARILPALFLGLSVAPPPALVYFPVSVSSRRRKPGSNPFLSVDACLDRIQQLCRSGLPPAPESEEWWGSDLPSILGAEDPGLFDTPVALTLGSSLPGVAWFRSSDDPQIHVFTHRLHGAFGVALSESVDDEWWQTNDPPYEDFRAALATRLGHRGIAVSAYPDSERRVVS